MATVAELTVGSIAPDLTLADLISRFGPMPLARIRREPRPGTATEADVVRINERKEGRCELIDGILLEKTMGWHESFLGFEIAAILRAFVQERNLGIVLGDQAMVRLWPGRIRLPDGCFLSWQRMGTFPDTTDPAINMGPDLAIEVISPSNTRQEMQEKLQDYFVSGVLEVWYVYPARREVHVYSGVETFVVLGNDDTLSGGQVLPGFSIVVSQFFAQPKRS